MIARKFVDRSTFRELARRDLAAGAGVLGDARVLKMPSVGSRVVPWVLSDGSLDRQGDTINPTGWDTTNFRRNNVVLWSHDSGQPPIGRATNVRSDGARLLADIEFAPPETSAFADSVYRLVAGGFIKAGSVGFIPIEWEFSRDKNRPNGIDFKRQELIEFSICSVPANSNALAQARAKGFDISPLASRREKTPMSAYDRRREAVELQVRVARMEMSDPIDVDGWERGKERLRRYLPQLERMQRDDEVMGRR